MEFEPVGRKPTRPALVIGAIGALQSQHEVRQTLMPAPALRAVTAWAQRYRPAELVIPLRTGLPSWLGFQALQRGWPLSVVRARGTLERAPMDVLPLLLELWLGAASRLDVSDVVERDRHVRALVPIITMREIMEMRLPKMGTDVVQPIQEVEAR